MRRGDQGILALALTLATLAPGPASAADPGLRQVEVAYQRFKKEGLVEQIALAELVRTLAPTADQSKQLQAILGKLETTVRETLASNRKALDEADELRVKVRDDVLAGKDSDEAREELANKEAAYRSGMRKARVEAAAQALAVLTDEQKTALEAYDLETIRQPLLGDAATTAPAAEASPVPLDRKVEDTLLNLNLLPVLQRWDQSAK